MSTMSFGTASKKQTVATRKNHDGSDEPLPGRKPSQAFMTALKAVRVTPEKPKK